MYSFCEPWNSKLYNYYTIINLVIYLIAIVLFLVRYIKIINIRKICQDNEGLCNEKYINYSYYDMMPLSLSISIVLIYILYLICPLKCHFLYYKFQQSYYNNKYFGFHQKKKFEYFLFLISFKYCIYYYFYFSCYK